MVLPILISVSAPEKPILLPLLLCASALLTVRKCHLRFIGELHIAGYWEYPAVTRGGRNTPENKFTCSKICITFM